MPAFDTLQGFLLLLLLPALWLFRRKRSQLRTAAISVLPIMRDLFERHAAQPPRIFRLKRKQRAVLYSAALLCTIFAFNGFHLKTEKRVPGKWILVLDNPFVLNLSVEGRPLTGLISDGARRLLSRIPSGDSIALLITSPEPTFLTGLNRREARAKVKDLEPSVHASSVESLADLVVAASTNPGVSGAVVLSPRAHSWRRILRERQAPDRVLVPPDRELLTGNTGIVAFDVRPSEKEEGRYDLFVRTSSHHVDSPVVYAELSASGNPWNTLAIRVDDEGYGRHLSRNVAFSPGEVTLSLDLEDHFTHDNRVRAYIPENRKIQLRLIDEPHPFLREAILSYDGYIIGDEKVGPNVPKVDIFIGSAPGERVERPSLIIRPKDDFLDFRFNRFLERPAATRFHPTHPATRNAAFKNFRPTRTIDFHIPPGFEILARAEESPLVIAGNHSGHRVMVWTFDPVGAGIFLEPSFIILLRDSLNWLTESTGSGGWGQDRNLLDPLITEQAGSIALPDPETIDLASNGQIVPGRILLAPWLLMAAFGLLAYLMLVEAYLSEGTA